METKHPFDSKSLKPDRPRRAWGSVLVVIGPEIPAAALLNQVSALRDGGDEFPVKIIGHEGEPKLLKRIKAALKTMPGPVAMLVGAHGQSFDGSHGVNVQDLSESDSDSEGALNIANTSPLVRTARIVAIASESGATLLAIMACKVQDTIEDLKSFAPKKRSRLDLLLIGDRSDGTLYNGMAGLVSTLRFVCASSDLAPPSRVAPFVHLLHCCVLGITWLKLTGKGFKAASSAALHHLSRHPLQDRLDAPELSSLVKESRELTPPPALSGSDLANFAHALLFELVSRCDAAGVGRLIEDCRRLGVELRGDVCLGEYSAIHLASIRRSFDIIKLLSDRGAVLNVRTSRTRRTPLIHAVLEGSSNLRVIDFLIAKSSTNLNAVDATGHTALGFAIVKNESAIAERLLLDSRLKINAVVGKSVSALLLATMHRRAKMLKLLIQNKGLDINQTDRFKQSALILAAKMGWLRGVKILMGRWDLNLYLRDHKGRNAIDVAEHKGIRKLLSAPFTSPS